MGGTGHEKGDQSSFLLAQKRGSALWKWEECEKPTAYFSCDKKYSCR